jgi:metallophosphoesterase (TIGR00282 family)
MGKTVLYIAEIVTKSGVYCVKNQIKSLKKEYQPDFIIANGDGATGGYGIGKTHSIYLRKLGIDVITTGDQVYFKKDIQEHLPKAYHLLRPANFPQGNPGRGWRTYTIGGKPADGRKPERSEQIVVISLLGQSGLNRLHPSNPYLQLPGIVERAKKDADLIILDFHAPITAEKATMNLYADGRVSAVVGSGMRVQTSDARILPKGTAVIADAGRTGSIQSVNGFEPETEIRQQMTAIPERSNDHWEGLEVQGVVLRFDDEGRAESIEPFRRSVPSPEPDGADGEKAGS